MSGINFESQVPNGNNTEKFHRMKADGFSEFSNKAEALVNRLKKNKGPDESGGYPDLEKTAVPVAKGTATKVDVTVGADNKIVDQKSGKGGS